MVRCTQNRRRSKPCRLLEGIADILDSVAMSAINPGCVKTYRSQECAELFSLSSSLSSCPCRKPYPAWQSIENRTMIVRNEGSLQAHWLDGCRSDPVAGNA